MHDWAKKEGMIMTTHLTINAYSTASHWSVDTHTESQITHGLVVHALISVVMAVAGLNDEWQQVQNKQTRSMNTQPSKENMPISETD